MPIGEAPTIAPVRLLPCAKGANRMVRRSRRFLIGGMLLAVAAPCSSPGPTDAPGAAPVPAPTSTAAGTPAPATAAAPTATAPPLAPVPRPLKGVSLSPKSFKAADFVDFFKKATDAGAIVSWAGDWRELENTGGGGPTVVAGLAATYGYTPVIMAQFFSQSSGQLLRPLDAATITRHTNGVRDFAQRHRPPYVGLGIEVNILYEQSPADFDLFLRLMENAYDSIKSVSPNTTVFTVFQLEQMKGPHGGLFGGVNDPNTTQWHLLDRVPKADLIAFTTYPGLIYTDPKNLPTDYYADIRTHTAMPIAFTEVGWHSAASPRGWESSEAEQEEFAEVSWGRPVA